MTAGIPSARPGLMIGGRAAVREGFRLRLIVVAAHGVVGGVLIPLMPVLPIIRVGRICPGIVGALFAGIIPNAWRARIRVAGIPGWLGRVSGVAAVAAGLARPVVRWVVRVIAPVTAMASALATVGVAGSGARGVASAILVTGAVRVVRAVRVPPARAGRLAPVVAGGRAVRVPRVCRIPRICRIARLSRVAGTVGVPGIGRVTRLRGISRVGRVRREAAGVPAVGPALVAALRRGVPSLGAALPARGTGGLGPGRPPHGHGGLALARRTGIWAGAPATRRVLTRPSGLAGGPLALRATVQRLDHPAEVIHGQPERPGAGTALPDAEDGHTRVGVPAQPHAARVASHVEEHLAEPGQRGCVRR